LHANHYDTAKSNYHQITICPQLQNTTNNEVAPPTKSVIPETAKRIRGRATGYDMKSPKKKKPTEQADNTSSWANEAGSPGNTFEEHACTTSKCVVVLILGAEVVGGH
jgi:hypothetical protein